jgi:hypothetical protein
MLIQSIIQAMLCKNGVLRAAQQSQGKSWAEKGFWMLTSISKTIIKNRDVKTNSAFR